MKKFLLLVVGAAVAVAITASIAMAAVTVKSLPTASFSGASVTVSGGNFSGLGSTPAFATVTASGQATYTCTNKGGNAAPGQNPVQAQGGSSGPVQLTSDHNGRSTIPQATATVTAPPTPSAQQVGCGGGGSTSWMVTLNTLTATSAHLEITQGGSLIYCRNYTLGGPSIGTAC